MSIEQFIENEVKSNDVVLFMKGTPQFPQCGFSGQVVQILDHIGVGYKGLNVLESADLRNGIKTYSNWPTIPQLYVKGEFVGGCDIIREMFQAGELLQLFADKGIAVNAAAWMRCWPPAIAARSNFARTTIWPRLRFQRSPPASIAFPPIARLALRFPLPPLSWLPPLP